MLRREWPFYFFRKIIKLEIGKISFSNFSRALSTFVIRHKHTRSLCWPWSQNLTGSNPSTYIIKITGTQAFFLFNSRPCRPFLTSCTVFVVLPCWNFRSTHNPCFRKSLQRFITQLTEYLTARVEISSKLKIFSKLRLLYHSKDRL